MWQKIVSFFLSIIAFFASIFGFSFNESEGNVYMDLAYGTHERQVMDLYLPENSDGETALVLFIHGGAWIGGDKDAYRENIKSVCREFGYATAAINYRYLAQGVTLHDIADDIEKALGVISEKGKEKGININKVLLTGSSAGAHLAMFYAYSRADVSPIAPAAVVSFCGPTDLADENFYIDNDLGGPESIADLLSLCIGRDFSYSERGNYIDEIKAVSPIYYVNENTVPTIICHGEKDTIVPYSNALALKEKFDSLSLDYVFISYPNSGHGLDKDADCSKAADTAFREYFEKYLGKEN